MLNISIKTAVIDRNGGENGSYRNEKNLSNKLCEYSGVDSRMHSDLTAKSSNFCLCSCALLFFSKCNIYACVF